MTLSLNWTQLIAVGATLLGGCATPQPAPCPVPLTTPPPRLMVPPESPATRERLEQLLPPTSPPASGTPSDSAGSSGG